MKLNVPILDKWAIYNDVLVGEALNHPEFETRQRIRTNKVHKLDKKLGVAICIADEIWQLGEPGNLSMYQDPVSKRIF